MSAAPAPLEPALELFDANAFQARIGASARQMADIAAFRRDEDLLLPGDLDYRAVGGLSNEAREKLGFPMCQGALPTLATQSA